MSLSSSSIFVIVKLVGSTKSPKNENTETVSATEETVSTANAKDTVTVPKVEGMTKDEAVKALNDVGLGYKQVVQSSKTVAKDTVISFLGDLVLPTSLTKQIL